LRRDQSSIRRVPFPSFDTPYRRRASNYRTKGRERSVRSDAITSRGLTEARSVIVSRRERSFIVPARELRSLCAFNGGDEGKLFQESRIPPGEPGCGTNETRGAARGVPRTSMSSVPSLICSYPVRICRSVLSRYEIAPAASVLLNY